MIAISVLSLRPLLENRVYTISFTPSLDDPRTFILHFPSGRRIELWSKGTVLTQEKGILRYATLLPLPEPVEFKQAVAHLDQILDKCKLNSPAEQARIKGWFGAPLSTTESYSGMIDFEPGCDLFYKVNAYDPESTQKWVISLAFER